MCWKQCFTPVLSMDGHQAQGLINEVSAQDLNIVDVRQPKEYEQAHIPGARLWTFISGLRTGSRIKRAGYFWNSSRG